MHDQHLAVAVHARADADSGNREAGGDPGGHVFRDAFEHDRERAGLLDGLSVGEQSSRRLFVPPLQLIPPEDVDGLRGQAQVSDDRDAGGDQRLDLGANLRPTFELHRRRSLLQEPPGVPQCVHRPRLIGEERQVHGDERPPDSSDHGAGVMDHVLQRHREGRFIPQDHHPQRIAHQHHVHPGLVHQAGSRIIIGSDHDDLLCPGFHLDQMSCADPLHCGLSPTPSSPRIPSEERRVWRPLGGMVPPEDSNRRRNPSPLATRTSSRSRRTSACTWRSRCRRWSPPRS